jgi:MFS family permease
VTAVRPLSRDFHRFWASAAASNLGDGIRLGALPLLALSLTDDARLIALVTASTVLPWLVFGPLGGAIVDRRDRRRLMIVGQLGRAVLVGVLSVLVITGTATIWWAVVLAFTLGLGEVIVDSSAQAAIPQLVEPDQLDRANGRMIVALTVLDKVVGITLGAILFAVAAGLPFVIDAVTFAVGALLIALIRRPLQGSRSLERRIGTEIVGGMRYLFRHRFLRLITPASAVSNMASYMSFAVLVVLVVDELGATEAQFGFVLGIGALGGVIGSVLASTLVERFGRRIMLGVPPFVVVAAFLIHASATRLWMVSFASFLINFAMVCFNVPAISIRQSVTPDELLGRVTANFRVFAIGAIPVGAVLGGFITEAAGVRVTNVSAAGFQAGSCLLLLLALRHLDDTLPAASEPTA